MPKKHNRKLGILGAAMTTARIPGFSLQVMTAVRDDLEAVMIDSGYLNGAPFEWVTISLRYGLKNEDEPHYERINKEYGDLPLAIELDTNELRSCDRGELAKAFEIAALKALVHAGRKFNLEYAALESRLKAYVG
ncbi:Imm39 family immunity protein [Botrimarina hoheduenensis]|uniref:Uncharacterized protein n=1 Tax=Botrimarina hoheduenensis TaxID=2528000 RepID=A0A5C5WAV5_9BACT|nr:Imm39 family immunity protein [Botrimarina hoheduenensis]TWT47209.1 hypothetical protein Pla111_08210 [Botrimarina hoheduenensis]